MRCPEKYRNPEGVLEEEKTWGKSLKSLIAIEQKPPASEAQKRFFGLCEATLLLQACPLPSRLVPSRRLKAMPGSPVLSRIPRYKWSCPMNPWLCFWKVSSQVAEEAHVPPASCVVTAPLYHVWLWEEPEPSFTTAKMFSVCCTDCHAVGCSPTAGTSSQRSLEKADALTASHLSKNKTVNASFKVVHSAALCQGEILLDAITLPSTSPHPTITGHKCMGRERQLSVLKKLLPAMSNAASRQKIPWKGWLCLHM